MKKVSDFNQELYDEMCEDNGCQYDPELKQEITSYYLFSE